MPPLCTEHSANTGEKHEVNESASNFAAALHQACFGSPLLTLCRKRERTMETYKKRKNVRFDTSITVHRIPSRCDLTAEDRQRLFYTRKDRQSMEKENSVIVALMNKAIYPDDETMYFRGLEKEMQETMEHRKHIIAAVQAAVVRQTKNEHVALLQNATEVDEVRNSLVLQSQRAALFSAAWDAKHCLEVVYH